MIRQDNPVSIIAKDKADFIRQVKEYAETDVPEGTHFFHISAKLLDILLTDGKEMKNHAN